MQLITTSKNCGTNRPSAFKPREVPQDEMYVCESPSKGAVPGIHFTNFPLGGKTQAAIPVLIRNKTASSPEPAVEFGETKERKAPTNGR
ncbi:hypothetical protein [Methanoregula sp.]|uniref:hypothetical protein n=1 Tax=Methanoregula sp. TaxID=2052170 RepID=UPI003C70AFB5